MKVNADKARGLDAAEITKQLKDASEQMFRLRFQLSMGQADGLTKLRKLRKGATLGGLSWKELRDAGRKY